VVAAAGCTYYDDPEERRAALVALVEILELDPLPDEKVVRIGDVQSKLDNPYYVATGRVYVQASVGREGSNQAWTDPERPC
jgi:hypothetical protein